MFWGIHKVLLLSIIYKSFEKEKSYIILQSLQKSSPDLDLIDIQDQNKQYNLMELAQILTIHQSFL